jgi:hypothetical protein
MELLFWIALHVHMRNLRYLFENSAMAECYSQVSLSINLFWSLFYLLWSAHFVSFMSLYHYMLISLFYLSMAMFNIRTIQTVWMA